MRTHLLISMHRMYKIRPTSVPFRTSHSPSAAEELSLASHVSDERLLCDFSVLIIAISHG
jgi:hypothetical protein